MTILLSAIGAFNIVILGILVVGFNLLQWLFAPKIIDALYKVREVDKLKNPKLYGLVEGLCRKMGMPVPKVMIAEMPISNTFAYGSPISGSRVAVTSTLLRELEELITAARLDGSRNCVIALLIAGGLILYL